MKLDYKLNLFSVARNSAQKTICPGFFKVLLILLLALLPPLLSFNLERVAAQTAQTQIYFAGQQPKVGIVGGGRLTAQINLTDFADPNGLAAFYLKIKYDPNLLTLTDNDNDGKADLGAVTVGAFLGSSGKQVVCSDGFIDPNVDNLSKKLLTFSCVTLGTTSTGPTGNGVLATVNFTIGNNLGTDTLVLVSSELVNNNIENPSLIPHVTGTLHIQVAKCGDFDGNRIVTVQDILIEAGKYGLTPASPGWDPKYDVNGDNVVNVLDILTVAREFGMSC